MEPILELVYAHADYTEVQAMAAILCGPFLLPKGLHDVCLPLTAPLRTSWHGKESRFRCCNEQRLHPSMRHSRAEQGFAIRFSPAHALPTARHELGTVRGYAAERGAPEHAHYLAAIPQLHQQPFVELLH